MRQEIKLINLNCAIGCKLCFDLRIGINEYKKYINTLFNAPTSIHKHKNTRVHINKQIDTKAYTYIYTFAYARKHAHHIKKQIYKAANKQMRGIHIHATGEPIHTIGDIFTR